MRYGILALLLTGCVTANPIVAPSGQKGYAISCGGTAQNWGQCYEKAGELCPKGYDIQGGGGDSGAFVVGSGGSVTGGTVVQRSMVVTCK